MRKTWSYAGMRTEEPAPTGRPAGEQGWAGLANLYYWIDRNSGLAGFWATQLFPFFGRGVCGVVPAFRDRRVPGGGVVNGSEPGVPLAGEELLLRPVRELARAVRDGSCQARELADRSRQRIAQTDGQLRAWVVLNDPTADPLADPPGDPAGDPAVDDGRGGPLAGVPLGVKDIIDVAGLPTRCGSPLTSQEPVAVSAPLVERLVSLGAVVQGKTVTTEFAYFAPGPTVNPRALGRTPGGSSSGSAAAVAAGHVPVAIGSQTAGSTIRPASYCGIAGFVPPHGSLDATGFLTICPSLDTPGFFARTVADLATVLAALDPEMFDEADDAKVPAGVEVLWWDGSGLDELDRRMVAAVEEAVALLGRERFQVRALPWDEELATLSGDHACVMAQEMAEQLGELAAANPGGISPQLADQLRAGASIPASAYREALSRRHDLRRTLGDRLGARQLVLGPATPGPAPAGLDWTGPPSMNRPWQMLGWPQLAVPGAETADGLPLGVQLIARPGQENLLLSVGHVLERALREHRNDA